MTKFEVAYRAKANRYLGGLLALHIPVLFCFALILGTSPAAALVGSVLLSAAPLWLIWRYPHTEATSIAIGAAMMGFSGLLIYLGNGRIEYHFHVFSFLAVITALASVRAQIVAAATIAAHHVVGWLLVPRAIFNYDAVFGDVVLHAFFVVLETAVCAFIAKACADNISIRGVLEEQVNLGASQLAAGSNEIANFMQQLANSVSSQAGIANQVVETGDEMRRNLEANLHRAQQVVQEFSQSTSAMAGAQQALESINAEIGESAREGKKISTIVSVMNDIARQINLLAVNASIEASRSGVGSGFGVIADQVRELAVKTSNATGQIDDMLQRSVLRLESGSSSLNEVAASFRLATTTVARFEGIVRELSELQSRQVSGIYEITNSMQRISASTEECAAGAEETAGTSRQFAVLASDLKSTLSHLG